MSGTIYLTTPTKAEFFKNPDLMEKSKRIFGFSSQKHKKELLAAEAEKSKL